MENYFYENNNKSMSEEELNDKKINVFNKLKNKKKKIKAYEIQVKEFFSDNEDENYKIKRNNIIDKYGKQKKVQLKQYHESTKNSILFYKDQLQKKSTIETPNKKTERQNFKEDINSKSTARKSKTKKVNFPQNFVKYINIESYKKYNSENYYLSLKLAENKVDSKCCIIC